MKNEATNNFEKKFTTYFQNKIFGSSKLPATLSREVVYVPDQGDYFILARNYANLSKSFKKAYKAALKIPVNFFCQKLTLACKF